VKKFSLTRFNAFYTLSRGDVRCFNFSQKRVFCRVSQNTKISNLLFGPFGIACNFGSSILYTLDDFWQTFPTEAPKFLKNFLLGFTQYTVKRLILHIFAHISCHCTNISRFSMRFGLDILVVSTLGEIRTFRGIIREIMTYLSSFWHFQDCCLNRHFYSNVP